MRVNENRCRRATSADFFEDFAVGHLRETASAVFLGRSHSKHTDAPQPIDHAAWNICLPIDFGRIEILIQKFAKFSKRVIQFTLFCLPDPRIRHYPIGHEMPLEQSFREPQRLGPCKKQFLSLLNLFLSLRVEFVHSIEKWATNTSRACWHVQSGAISALGDRKAPGRQTSMLQLMVSISIISCSPGWCRIRCR